MKKLLLWALILSSAPGFAAILSGPSAKNYHPQASEVRTDDRNGNILYVQFDPMTPLMFTGNGDQVKTILKGGSGDSWKLVRNDRDEIGMDHSRYQQYFRQVPVYTGEYIMHSSAGRLVSMNGQFFSGLNVNTTPAISEKSAASFAVAAVPAVKYLWQESLAEQRILSGDDNGYAYPKGELVIVPQTLSSAKGQNELAYRYDVYATNPHQRYTVFVSAADGHLILKESRICNTVATGTGNLKYSGTQSFITDQVTPTSFRLRDATRGSGVETYNLLNGTNYSAAVDFTDADNNWTSTLNQDNAALDAHWGAEKTYDYYLNVHSRNSFDNTGGAIKSYVHYSVSYNNAFWNGSVMTYGDGDGSQFSPLTELDIVGHEISHGVTERSSALVYLNESGALNESFSDIFGISVDFNARPGTANWMIGDQSYTPSVSGDALRFMNNPNAGGQPDTYKGSQWYTGTLDNGGVHTNSGVQNLWFYLLSQGGSGTNDNGFAYSVAGITINKARLIAYRNNTFYLTSGSQYADAAFYAVKAATDLYGVCSPEAVSTKNAWEAVGLMGLSLNTNADVQVLATPCTGGALQLSATGGSTFQWTGPNGFTSNLQNPVINNLSAVNNGTYRCTITAAAGCTGKDSALVSVVAPPSLTVTGSAAICPGASTPLLATAAAAGQGQNSATSTAVVSVPDNNPNGATASITINGSTVANAIQSITIDSLTHTWDGDMTFILIAPNGSQVTLASAVGGSGQNFLHTRFVPSGATAINNGVAPFTGNFTPAQPFSGLSGTANGVWKLKMVDAGPNDLGVLYKWSLVLPGNTIASYAWTPAATLNNPSVNNPVATPGSTTTYGVVVTDAQGCTASGNAIVTVKQIEFTATVNHVGCNGGNTGSIQLNITGGSAPYQTSWSNGATGSTISNLTAGAYTATITDAGGCTRTGVVTVAEPALLTLTISKVNPGCGQSTGSLTANVTGGVSPYTYMWSNGVTTPTASGLTAGTYTVIVTDANGCSVSLSSTLTSSGNLPGTPGSITGPKTAVCANTTVAYTSSAVTGATSYLWTPPSGATVSSGQGTRFAQITFPAGFVSGNLSVAAVNACGPGNSRTVALKSIPGTPGSVMGNYTNLCGATNVAYSIPAAVTGATSYNWTTPSYANIVSGQGTTSILVNYQSVPATAGQVCVTADNACGSSASRCRTGITTSPAKPAAITGPASVCKNQAGVQYSTVLQPNVTFTWTVPTGAVVTSGQGTSQITVTFGTTSGSVKVKGTNACGVTSLTTLNVAMPCRIEDAKSFAAEVTPNPSNGNASLIITGNPGRYTVEISNVLGQQLFSGVGTDDEFAIPAQNFKAGLYLVKISTADTQRTLRMIIE